MERRTFCRIGGLAAGSLFALPLLGRDDPSGTSVRADPTYALQVAASETFDAAGLVVDAADLTESAYNIPGLQSNTTYFWRVAVMQDGLAGPWSETASFTTGIVLDAEPGPARLTVYTLTNRTVETLEDDRLPDRAYETRWDPGLRAAGTYLVVLQAGSFSQTRRVVLG